MNERQYDERWALGCAELPHKCAVLCKQAAENLLGPVTLEARQLTAQGFVAPAPEALMHAAFLFEQISQLPGGAYWLSRPPPRHCIQVLLAFANTFDGIERELQLEGLSTWWSWRDSDEVGEMTQFCLAIRTMLNAKKMDRVLELYNADLVRVEVQYGANR